MGTAEHPVDPFTLSECKALYDSIPRALVDPAVAFLRKELSPAAAEIRDAIKADPKTWWAPYHFGWGTATRNVLRQGGFGEEYFKIGNLDDIYTYLVEEAVNQ